MKPIKLSIKAIKPKKNKGFMDKIQGSFTKTKQQCENRKERNQARNTKKSNKVRLWTKLEEVQEVNRHKTHRKQSNFKERKKKPI